MPDIIELSASDATAVIALWRQAGLTRPWNSPERDFAQAIASAGSTVLGAIDAAAGGDDDRDAATADGSQGSQDANEARPLLGTVMAGYDGHRGWIYYLAVADKRRHEGIGRALVAAAERWLLAQGAAKAQLMVRSENTKVAEFYHELGYEDVDSVLLGKRFIDPSV